MSEVRQADPGRFEPGRHLLRVYRDNMALLRLMRGALSGAAMRHEAHRMISWYAGIIVVVNSALHSWQTCKSIQKFQMAVALRNPARKGAEKVPR
ncbi:hypothetical protein BV25DRAFT_1827590 [Artomyces pyxidatus]|uniref:Uncharacterized protein n=1 Tax=Artomyces pyxidatus TaxID=48021 RepID=A0ACB8SYD3_9AGAM|nr:hypothetical protein BV25DRAFT_1827590 [Artomyces pyxidatus]